MPKKFVGCALALVVACWACAVFAAEETPTPPRREEPRKEVPKPSAEAVAQMKERRLSALRSDVETTEKRLAGLAEEINATHDADLKAAAEALAPLLTKKLEIATAMLAAAEKDDDAGLRAAMNAPRELQPQIVVAQRRYDVFKENQRLRDMAARIGGAEALALADRAIKANLAILAVEEQIAKLNTQRAQLDNEKRTAQLDLERRVRGSAGEERGERPGGERKPVESGERK